MRTASTTDLRENLAKLLDSVTDDHTPLLITRDRGRPPAVLISLEDFSSYAETNHLLQNPHNARRLMEAVRELEAGGGQEHELIE